MIPPTWPGRSRPGGLMSRTLADPSRVMVDFAAYLVVRVVVAVIQVLPTDMGGNLCRSLAAGCQRAGIRRTTTHRNLDRHLPNLRDESRRAFERRMWHSLLLTVCEVAWTSRRLHRANWARHVNFHGNRLLLDRLLSDRPAIVVTGHFGNFEVGGYVMGLMGFETLSIARRLDNRFLHDWLVSFRERRGQRLVDKNGCADAVESHLAAGGVLTLLADQHAGEKGCWVNFLGRPASCHKALALFSLSTDAPMAVVGTVRRSPMQLTAVVAGAVDPTSPEDAEAVGGVKPLTEWYNDRLGEVILRHPEQYWWLHNRWRKPPPKVAKRLARAA